MKASANHFGLAVGS